MPDGKALSLHERDGRYTIRVDGLELMSTHQHSSEEKLAELACAALKPKRGARILIGGLGFGFTLKAALSFVSSDAKIVVAEIVAAVIDWNRNPAYPLAAKAIADRRVKIVQRDVAEILLQPEGGFDAILLDVDNGPAALSTKGNRHLYEPSGLLRAKSALRPGGCVAFWSASADPAFAKLMSGAGFTVEVQRTRAHPTSGGWHTLFLGRVR